MVSVNYTNDIKTLASIYACADVFLNFSDEDSFSKVTAESMACGTPVIGFNSTAIPEVIGDTGVILDPNATSSDMIKALKDLKQADLTILSKKARLRAEQLFDQNKNYKKYLDLILLQEKQ